MASCKEIKQTLHARLHAAGESGHTNHADYWAVMRELHATHKRDQMTKKCWQTFQPIYIDAHALWSEAFAHFHDGVVAADAVIDTIACPSATNIPAATDAVEAVEARVTAQAAYPTIISRFTAWKTGCMA